MLQKLMKNEDRAPGQAGIEVMVAPTPSPEATNFQVVMWEGVDEGLYLESAPLWFSEAELCFAILIHLIGNVSVSVCKFCRTHVKEEEGWSIGTQMWVKGTLETLWEDETLKEMNQRATEWNGMV